MPLAAPPVAPDLERRLHDLRANRWSIAQASARDRAAKLRHLQAAVLRHRAAIHAALHADLNRPAEETEVAELQPLLLELEHAIRNVKRWMKPRRVPTPLVLAGTRGEVRYEPRGVVLILAPWNYPFNLALAPLVAAVAAGNCAVVKPSEKAPRTAEVVAAVLRDTFPEDEVACVLGGPEVAEALTRLPFDHIFFTGSPRLGRKVMRAAAEQLASVTLELGGKSPAIVAADADVGLAAERIAWGKFMNAGQTCIAPDYALVPGAREAEFVAAVAAAVERMYGGAGHPRRAPDYCRLVDERATARLAYLLEESLRAGARLALGGEFDRETRFLAPTVLTGVTPESPIMQEEIFGPILPVLAYETLDEALALVRAQPKPLALYVFSRERATLERVLRHTSAGATVWNNVSVHYGNFHLPFGGVGESGMGSYHGWHGFRAFSHERAVVLQSRFSLLHRLYPPYGEHTRKLLAWMDRLRGL